MASLASLVLLQNRLAKERAEVMDQMSGWDEEIRRKKHIVTELERTLEALRANPAAPGPRTAAEVSGATEAPGSPKHAHEGHEELLRRFSSALAELPTWPTHQWREASFQAHFSSAADGQLAELLGGPFFGVPGSLIHSNQPQKTGVPLLEYGYWATKVSFSLITGAAAGLGVAEPVGSEPEARHLVIVG